MVDPAQGCAAARGKADTCCTAASASDQYCRQTRSGSQQRAQPHRTVSYTFATGECSTSPKVWAAAECALYVVSAVPGNLRTNTRHSLLHILKGRLCWHTMQSKHVQQMLASRALLHCHVPHKSSTWHSCFQVHLDQCEHRPVQDGCFLHCSDHEITSSVSCRVPAWSKFTAFVRAQAPLSPGSYGVCS